jgi:signal transduction histidine kinase
MGLGLFLVRLVAERCGAEFSLYSKLGEGTRCVLAFAAGSELDSTASPTHATIAT